MAFRGTVVPPRELYIRPSIQDGALCPTNTRWWFVCRFSGNRIMISPNGALCLGGLQPGT